MKREAYSWPSLDEISIFGWSASGEAEKTEDAEETEDDEDVQLEGD